MTRETVARGRVTKAVVSGGRVLLDVQVLADETRSRVELLLSGGVTDVPANGTDVILLEVGGNRDHLVAVVADDPALRITGLAQGERGIRDSRGQQVLLKADGIHVSGAAHIFITGTADITVDAPTIKLGSGATKAVKLSDGSNATKVFAE